MNKKERVCMQCGADMNKRHHTAKYCHDCVVIRQKAAQDERNLNKLGGNKC